MNKRFERLEVLRVILESTGKSSHNDILNELEKHGIHVTQATLSRDLGKMHAIKVMTPEGYRYVLPDSPLYRRAIHPDVIPQYLRNTGFQNLAFSVAVAVMHTRPGYAAGLATDIDTHELPSILGTVSGDDTIILVLNEKSTKEDVLEDLATVIPAIKNLVF